LFYGIYNFRAVNQAGQRGEKAADDLKLSLDLAAQLGARSIASHALLHHTYARADVARREIAVETLTELAPTIRAAGVKVAIENGYPDTTLTLAAFDALPPDAFGFVIDTGHANISGGNDNIAGIIHTVGTRMVTLHLNDNDGTQDSHHPPGGAGCTIDWPAAARHLSDGGYDDCYLWEVFSRLGGRTDTPAETLARTAAMSGRLFHSGNGEA
jgi:sugar phosphate isomerase/epimerase